MKNSMNKWRKHQILQKDPLLAAALPPTRLFTKRHFFDFLARFSTVIIKPNTGKQGMGVIMVSALGKQRYSVHSGANRRILSGPGNAYRHVKMLVKSRPCLIQRRIHLAEVNGRPFDVRVMVQRPVGSAWKVTGKLAKVAGPGFIITNTARSRGKVLPIHAAIQNSSLKTLSPALLAKKINRISLRSAAKLQSSYRWISIVGMDVGVDKQGNVWIIEANFFPALSLFRKLKDKRMYWTILANRRRRSRTVRPADVNRQRAKVRNGAAVRPGVRVKNGAAFKLADRVKTRAAVRPGALAQTRAAVRPGALAQTRAAVRPGALVQTRAAVRPGALVQTRAAVRHGALVQTRAAVRHGALVQTRAAVRPGATAQNGAASRRAVLGRTAAARSVGSKSAF
ncbi:YheC/YheD family protein [Brevibacillus sp. B_LB10_24]|uniref:YheC/YheD family protein n=1 Tax=Brevibacillus sp. B_LB10_24 TaxID=3380645 RepID=UPI0038BB9A29